MGLFSFLRGDDIAGQKALSATPNVLEAMANRTFSGYPLIATPPQQRRIDAVYVEAQNASYAWMYRTQPAVRRVVDYIARNVAQLGLKVYERVSDDEREHRGDHPAAAALRRPNPHTPGTQFVYEFVSDFFTYDNAYALKFRGDNGRLLLVRLVPHLVGLVGRSHFTIDAYRIWRTDGTSFDVAPEEMIHWRGYNPDDPRKGESKLETLREELAADLASRKSVTELHRSGLTLPGWIERPLEAPEWKDEGARRFKEDWAAQAQDSRRRAPVLEEGMAYKTGGVTPEDAEYLDTRRFSNEQVASQYGMENVPPKNKDERQQFYADILPPFTKSFADFLGLQILEAEYGDDDHYFEFNMDEKLMGDDRLKALTSAAGAPILTRNEARARSNLPAKKGGDELITPANVIVGDNPRPSPGVMPIQDPNKPPQDGSHRSGEANEPAPAGRRSLNGHHKASLIPRRALADQRRNRWAQEYEDILGSHFARQRRSMRAKSLSREQAVKALEAERWDKELGQDLDEISRRHFRSEGKQASFRMAAEFDPDQGVNWLTAKAEGSAKDINKVTREHVEERGISDAFTYAVSARAIAGGKGYATDIAGFATKEAIQQSPDGDTRTVTIDGGECDICAEFQGSWDFKDVPGWPAYHANCNCIADIDGGGEPVGKALEKQAPPVINNNVTSTPPPAPEVHNHFDIQVPEGLFKSETHIEAAPAPTVNVTTPDINVAPAQVTIEKGAVEAPVVNVEAAEAPEVKFEKGAISTNVEAPPPANVNIEDGAIEVNVNPGDVTVEGAQAPNVNLTVEQPKTTKRVVRDKQGHIKEIVEENSKQVVKRDSKNRIQSIEEE